MHRPRLSRPRRPLGTSLLTLGLSLCQTTAWAEDSRDDNAVPTVTVEARRQSLIGQPVDAEGVDDYRVTHGTTAAKADLADRDIPQAVTTIGAKVMEEQGSRTLNDVLRNVAGAQASQSALQGAQWPIMRGFETRNFYKDGLRDDTFDRTYWLGNVERIEVLKGPASVLYGDGAVGGVVNVVTRKPLPITTYSGLLWGGSYENSGLRADVSAKLSDSGDTLLRVIADGDHKDTFVRHFGYDEGHVSAQGQTLLGERTALTLAAEYRRRDQNGNDFGIPGYALKWDLPASTSYDADWSERTDAATALSGRLTHELADDWSVTSALLLNRYTFDQVLTSTGYSAANKAAQVVSRTPNATNSVTRELVSDTNIQGRTRLAGMDHAVLGGVEIAHGTVDRTVWGGTATTTSIYSPTTAYAQPTWNKTWDQTFTTHRQGVYAQDLVALTDRLKVMGGLRYDTVKRKSVDGVQPTNAARNATTDDSKASKRVGATFEAVPGITLYGGWSRSFVPPGTTVSVGTLPQAPPEMGEQYEGGVKLDLGQAFTATAAVYRLTRENVRTTNSVTSITTVTGEQRSDGVELDATWKITPNWNALLAYAYTDARVTQDDTYVIGSALPNVPMHSARLWSMVRIPAGPLAGLSLGGGVTWVGERAANLKQAAVYTMPSYATVDLAAQYELTDHVTVSLNADNVLNERYYISSGTYQTTDTPMVNLGEPFTLMARLKVTY